MPLTYYVEFKTGPRVNVTDYVKSIDIRKGITDPMRHIADVGTCTFVMDNADRYFSPGITSGPVYPLTINSPVRVQVTDGVTTWTVFVGKIRSITPATGRYTNNECTIEAVDALSVAQDATIALPIQQGRTGDEMMALVEAAILGQDEATATATFSAAPSNGDTITLNGTQFQFVTSITTANDVLIGTGANAREDTIDNLVAAVNGEDGLGTVYSSVTTRPTELTVEPIYNYFRRVQNRRPVRYYRLDETAGTSAGDSGTNNAPGTYVGSPTLNVASYLSDGSKAVTFNGSTQYVTVPTLEMANKSFSVEVWVKPTASPNAVNVLVDFYTGVSSYFSLGFYNNYFVFADINGSAMFSGAAISSSGWTYILFTYNYTTDTATIYCEGAAGNSTATGTVGPFAGASPAITIGARNSGATLHAKATIDEVAIHWGVVTEYAQRVAAASYASGIKIRANAAGSWGNTIPIAKSSSVITLSGSTLSGGTTATGDYQAGLRRLDYVGNDWTSRDTDAMTAMEQLAQSEQGLVWCKRDNTLAFRNYEWVQSQLSATPALTLDSHQNEMEGGLYSEDLYTRVVVNYSPAGSVIQGQIARAQGEIKVPGRDPNLYSDFEAGKRRNPTDPFAGANTVTLPFVEVGTGQVAGAISIVLPLVRGTNYHVSDFPNAVEGTEKFGNYDNQADTVEVVAAIVGGEIQCALINAATGPLYVQGLYIEGEALITYEQQQEIADDENATLDYGLRVLNVDIPLASEGGREFAQSIAGYLLNRYKTPIYRVKNVSFSGQYIIGGVNVYSVEIGDVVTITDYQANITSQKHIVTGVSYQMGAGDAMTSSVSFDVRRLDDLAYAVWDTSVWDTGLWGL